MAMLDTVELKILFGVGSWGRPRKFYSVVAPDRGRVCPGKNVYRCLFVREVHACAAVGLMIHARPTLKLYAIT